IKLERVAHAFLLTGIRGGGKTTTARIIAKTLNCTAPTTEDKYILPCGACANCTAVSSESHPDIIELDAASRTGVDDMRQIIENTSYMPLLGKYKIYIIDEVHMLSTSAFNALLKTLEEPPAHVKFIFATTELRKVPITILSRCLKFELRRLTNDELVEHLLDILGQENIEAERDALQLIATHAEGSIRDSLSLLDLVISNANKEKITKEQVKNLLGLHNSLQIIELFEFIIEGNVAQSLELVKALYYAGKDLNYLPQQLMEIAHTISKEKLDIKDSQIMFSEEEFIRLAKLASKLSISSLTILWQMLLKASQELQYSNNLLISAEMLIIRLCHLSNLPTPAALLEKLKEANVKAPEISKKLNKPNINNFEDMVQLFYNQKEMLLYHYLVNDVHLVEFTPLKIIVRHNHNVPHNFSKKISELLKEWTGENWTIAVNTTEKGELTISDKLEQEKVKAIEEFSKNDVVQEILQNFNNAQVKLTS
ncbi:MAG: DNA polymerase III subunit gamma/tau, partial [Pseudomonadota bacterium]